jgi:hypothetical protein
MAWFDPESWLPTETVDLRIILVRVRIWKDARVLTKAYNLKASSSPRIGQGQYTY